MQTQSGDAAVVTINNTVDLATWNVPRSSEQLLNFINNKHTALPDGIEL